MASFSDGNADARTELAARLVRAGYSLLDATTVATLTYGLRLDPQGAVHELRRQFSQPVAPAHAA